MNIFIIFFYLGPHSDAQFISVKVETYLGICPELPCNFYRGDDVIATIKFINQGKDQ